MSSFLCWNLYRINKMQWSIKYHWSNWPQYIIPSKKQTPLGLWGDGVAMVPRVQFLFIYSCVYPYARAFEKKRNMFYFQNHNLSLNNRLPFNLYAGNIIRQASLNMILSFNIFSIILKHQDINLMQCSTLML